MSKSFFIPRHSLKKSRFVFAEASLVEGKDVPLLSLDSVPPPTEIEICLLQIHEPHSQEIMDRLRIYFDSWPKRHRLALEVSHDSWFKSSSFNEALQKWLQRDGVSLVINNAFGSHYFYHPHVKQEHVYIRYIGDGFIARDAHRLKQWAEKLADLTYAGMQIYFVVQDQEIAAVKSLRFLRDLLQLEDESSVPAQLDLFT